MRRRDTDNEHSNDDQTHAVARHRSPLFLFKPLAGAFAAIATRQCTAEVTQRENNDLSEM